MRLSFPRQAFVASYQFHNEVENPNAKPHTELFTSLGDDRLFQGFAPSYMVRPGLYNFTILKDYGIVRNWDEADAVEDRYQADYPEPPPEPYDVETGPVKRVNGWLSPEAVLYACDYMGHSNLAFDIVKHLYPDEKDSPRFDDTLYERGWVCLSSTVIHMSVDLHPTEQQVRWLRRLVELNPHESRYTVAIDRFLHTWLNDFQSD